jgi:hypothetical protein
MVWAPLRIYTGADGPGEALWLILAQGAWILVLAFVGSWLWRVNRQKVVIYGG